ncbi:MAG: DUF3108 domain-containing protein, partial [Raineya sp.]|nr:DUF3108 domain-containing protein [Raineya sp.]
GEEWVYKINKDGNEAAEITFQADKQLHDFNNFKCYKIIAKARITAFLGIVSVDNKITSWIENQKFKTQKVHIYYDDGKNKNNYIVECKPQKKQIEAYSLENPKEKQLFTWFSECEDVWSAVFQVRQKDFSKLKPNDTFSFCLMADENASKEVVLKYLGKKAMTFGNQTKECYILAWVSPVIKEVDERSIRMAITADKNQMLAKMYVKTQKGFFTAELKSFSKK